MDKERLLSYRALVECGDKDSGLFYAAELPGKSGNYVIFKK